MTLPVNALCNLATVKGELGILVGDTSKDTVLERLIGVASDAAEKFCGRIFYKATVTDERVKGFGGSRMLLARTPIVSLTSIVLDGSALDLSDGTIYIENPLTGIVFNQSGWDVTGTWSTGLAAPQQMAGSEEAAYKVTYVGGWVTQPQVDASTYTPRTLPYDLEHAAILTAVDLYRNRGKYQNLEAEPDEDEEDESSWPERIIPGPAKSILKRYRRVVL